MKEYGESPIWVRWVKKSSREYGDIEYITSEKEIVTKHVFPLYKIQRGLNIQYRMERESHEVRPEIRLKQRD